LKNQIYDFIEIVSQRINNSKNTQEKRILNSLIHYFKALIGYYDYWNIIDRSEHRGMSGVLEEGNNSKRLKSLLNYILEELNKGKRFLDLRADASGIEFFNKSIDYIQENEVNRIHSIEKDKTERIEREKIEKKIGKENKIRENKLIIFCAKGFAVGGLLGYLISSNIVTDYIHTLIYISIPILVVKFIILDAKEGFERDDRWANFIYFGIFLIFILIIICAIIFWILGNIGLDTFVSMGLLFICIFYYYGIKVKGYKSPI
jgi:hypothetical protein